ncbi:MAG: TIM barrel protein [Candidatus Hydrogenedentes bacterium]|nr:TIM barrel protein [Candidatus Hydrogenedentota bacterium]
MKRTGLVSITFRKYSPASIIDLVKNAELDCIEWGGDVHVPHGDLARAREVGEQTRAAGVEVGAYGSYYYVGAPAKNRHTFEQVLETAQVLGAPLIRVWAGAQGSKETPESNWAKVVDESRRIGSLAQQAGIKIAFKFHANTMNDTPDSSFELKNDINHPNVFSLWQPNPSFERRENQRGLRRMRPGLANIQVFHFRNGMRLPLEDGMDDWKYYLLTARYGTEDFAALIELVQQDAPSNFIRDARDLKKLVAHAMEQPLVPEEEVRN